jgi:type IV pilus assembly protein PilC
MHEGIRFAAVGSVLVACGLALALALRLCDKARWLRDDSAVHSLLTVAKWWLIVGGIMYMNFLVGAIAIVVFAMATTQYRARQRDMTLWSLAVAARRGIPLTAAAQVAVDQSSSAARPKTRQLASMLEVGISLDEALVRGRYLDSDDTEALLYTGQHFGALDSAIVEATDVRAKVQPASRLLAGRIFYLFLVVLASTLVMSFSLWKIMPAMGKIYADFAVALPLITQVFVDVGNFANNYGPLHLPFVAVLIALFLYFLFRYIGWIRPGIAMLGWLHRPRHASTILRCLAIVCERGKSFTDALDVLAERYPRGDVRRRLGQVVKAARYGEKWQSALQRAKFLRAAEVGILSAAERVGNLPWALRSVAAAKLRLSVYRTNFLTQVLTIVIILVVAVFMMFFVMAMFQPLVTLITEINASLE